MPLIGTVLIGYIELEFKSIYFNNRRRIKSIGLPQISSVIIRELEFGTFLPTCIQ